MNVNEIYQNVADILRDQSVGVMSNDEFNRFIPLVEDGLMEFWLSKYAQNKETPEALRGFRTKRPVAFSQGKVGLDDDVRFVVGALVKGNLATEANDDEWSHVLTSPIRGRSKFGGLKFVQADKGVLLSENFTGGGDLFIIKKPEYAHRAALYDAGAVTESYDPNQSKNFQWPESQRKNIVQGFLFYKAAQYNLENKFINFLTLKKELEHG